MIYKDNIYIYTLYNIYIYTLSTYPQGTGSCLFYPKSEGPRVCAGVCWSSVRAPAVGEAPVL